MAKFEHHKPLAMNAVVARAARRWALTPEAMPHRIAILPMLDPLLAKSGLDARADGNQIYQVPFLVTPERVRDTSRDVFPVLREYLDAGDVLLQFRTLASFQDALNGPMPQGQLPVTPKVLVGWEQDQLVILDLLAGFLSEPRPTVVQLRVVEVVQYQAVYGSRPAVRVRANAVSGLVDDSFEVRLSRLLLSRFARVDARDDDRSGDDGRASRDVRHARHQQRHRAVAEEVWQRYPDAVAAFTFLEATVRGLREVEREVEPYHLLWYLLDLRATEAVAFTELMLTHPASSLTSCFATCLAHSRRVDPTVATALARRAVESGHPPLVIGAANHYCLDRSDHQPLSDADAEVVRLLVGSPDPAVRTLELGALHHLARTTPRAAVELARGVVVGGAEDVGEGLARITDPTQPAALTALQADDLKALMRSSMSCHSSGTGWARSPVGW